MPERRVALRVVHEIAEAARDRAKITVYRWEDSLRDFRSDVSYQGNIPLPETFDIFIGFLHSRIGTQLSAESYQALVAQSLRALDRLDTGGADADDERLSALSEQLPASALPTGTTFEIRNALEAAQRAPGTARRPVCWLAMNNASTEALQSRDPATSEPARRAWDEVGAFRREVSDRTAFQDYGKNRQRQEQLQPNGLAEFEDMLRAWLTATLRDTFGLELRWHGRAYVGLRPFEPNDAPIFCGRRSSIDAAFSEFRRAVTEHAPRLMLLTGPSGAGKSSFARAGLVGMLDRTRFHGWRGAGALLEAEPILSWHRLILRPAELGAEPATVLLDRLGAMLWPDPSDATPAALRAAAETLAAQPCDTPEALPPPGVLAPIIATLQARLCRDGLAGLFILLDQAEEVFGLAEPPAIRRLMALLRALAADAPANIWVCVAVADQWRDYLRSAGLMAALEGARRFDLPPVRGAEISEIIETPARDAGLAFEQNAAGVSLARRIAADLAALSLHSEAPLPLLQVTLARLEDAQTDRAGQRLLTFAAYEGFGGVAGAIRNHASQALATMPGADRTAVLDRLLFRLLQRDPEDRIVTRLAPRAELEADPELWNAAAHLLAPEHRLLQGSGGAEDRALIRLAHDVLLEHAADVAGFIARHRDDLILLDNLRQDAMAWARRVAAERDLPRGQRSAGDLLLRDRDSLRRLVALLRRKRVGEAGELRRYAAASYAGLRAAQAAAREAQRQAAERARAEAELAEERMKAKRTLRVGLMGAAVAAMLIGAGIFAWNKGHEAQLSAEREAAAVAAAAQQQARAESEANLRSLEQLARSEAERQGGMAQLSYQTAIDSLARMVGDIRCRIPLGTRTSYDDNCADRELISATTAQQLAEFPLGAFNKLDQLEDFRQSATVNRSRSDLFGRIREIFSQTGDLNKAIYAGRLEVQALRELFDSKQDQTNARALVNSMIGLSRLVQVSSDTSSDWPGLVGEARQVAYRFRREAPNQDDRRRWQEQLSQIYFTMSDGYILQRHFPDANRFAQAAFSEIAELENAFNFRLLRQRAIGLGRLSDTFVPLGIEGRAIELMQENVVLSRRIVESTAGNPTGTQHLDARRGLSIALERRSFLEVWRTDGDRKVAYDLITEALNALPSLHDAGGTSSCFARVEENNPNWLLTRFYTNIQYLRSLLLFPENEEKRYQLLAVSSCMLEIVDRIKNLGVGAALMPVMARNEAVANYYRAHALRLNGNLNASAGYYSRCRQINYPRNLYWLRSAGDQDIQQLCADERSPVIQR